MDPILLTLPETTRVLGVGRTTVYRLVAEGALQRVKIRGKCMITTASIKALASCSSRVR